MFLWLDTKHLLPVLAIDHEAPVRPTAPPPSDVLARGEHLVKVAGCQGCHSMDLTGGGGPPPGASNITQAGLGDWNETDFVRAIRAGVAPRQRALAPSMPREYGAMTDAELHAIWTYLRTVAAKGEKSTRQNGAAPSAPTAS